VDCGEGEGDGLGRYRYPKEVFRGLEAGHESSDPD
jgi:hypothetical protein